MTIVLYKMQAKQWLARLQWGLAGALWNDSLTLLSLLLWAFFCSQNGLKRMIPEDKRVISDRGLSSKCKMAVLSTPTNSSDAAEVHKFKSRARPARHKSFNAKIRILEFWQSAFDTTSTRITAWCSKPFVLSVICQYQLEDGFPLFDTSMWSTSTTYSRFLLVVGYVSTFILPSVGIFISNLSTN